MSHTATERMHVAMNEAISHRMRGWGGEGHAAARHRSARELWAHMMDPDSLILKTIALRQCAAYTLMCCYTWYNWSVNEADARWHGENKKHFMHVAACALKM